MARAVAARAGSETTAQPRSEATARAARVPHATYRLQLHAGFDFAAAAAVVPYLRQLGIGDCYTSPLLQACPGSAHGYDIVDHAALSAELGGAAGFATFAAALAAHDLGLLIDVVPNHMGIDPVANRWWRDVLENGPCSPHARAFDIDWAPVKDELRDKVLLPILGDQYGLVLERGELQLAYADGGFRLRYFDHCLPINPRQVPQILAPGVERVGAALGATAPAVVELHSILTALRNLPVYTETEPDRVAERQREKEVARVRLARLVAAEPQVAAHVAACVAAFNRPDGAARLHQLLEAQPYRLAAWRTAAHEINYRRFFDINELAGLRMEDPAVFAASHALVLTLLGDGRVTGLRLDHVDGLYDPAGYLAALQAAARDAGAPAPLYLAVEKILGEAEALPADWPVAGTTGYDFLNECGGLFVDAASERALRRVYRRFTAQRAAFADVLYECKTLIMDGPMASELNMLAAALNRLSEHDPRTRDFTLNSLTRALREVVACFPVYRTYVSAAGASDSDRRVVDTALARTRRRHPTMERSILDFVRRVLLPDPAGPDAERRLDFARRFQQYTGPVEAKGREDTAFYRYVPLLALNDVGGDPERFGCSPAAFHAASRARHATWPHAMLATATHDTKRGEDARARLAALSELADEWGHRLSAWARANAAHRRPVDGRPAPDRNDEYLFYQALLGAWPPGAARADAELTERLAAYALKAAREAKRVTSWLTENAPYESALTGFVRGVLGAPGAARFLPLFLPFQARVAALGALNSLAQTTLKLVVPGVPDFYQGSELWDLSLVDPDNRRPVDYAHRRHLLAALDAARADPAAHRAVAAEALAAWPDGRIKLLLTAVLLRQRRADPELFRAGDYQPLALRGRHAERAVALARCHAGRAVVAVVPRLCAPLTSHERPFPLGDCWADTAVALPAGLAGRPLRDLVTGAAHAAADVLPLAALCADLPLAVLRG